MLFAGILAAVDFIYGVEMKSAGFHINVLPGLRIPSRIRFIIPHRENPKSPEVNSPAIF